MGQYKGAAWGGERTGKQPRQLSLRHRRSHLDSNGVLQPSEVLDVSTINLSRPVSNPQVMAARVEVRPRRRCVVLPERPERASR